MTSQQVSSLTFRCPIELDGLLPPPVPAALGVPDWFKADYFTYFPTLEQIKTQFKPVDWDAYNKSSKEWQDYYAQKIGQ